MPALSRHLLLHAQPGVGQHRDELLINFSRSAIESESYEEEPMLTGCGAPVG